MNRDRSREWTRDLQYRYLPDEPDAYRTFLHLAGARCPEGGKVVDLGCGGEGYLEFLLEKEADITGVDNRALDGPYRRYLEADLDGRLPLEEGGYDLAVGKFMLEHLERPRVFFREVYRILRPGGTLLLLTPNVYYYPYTVNFLLSRLISQQSRMRAVQLFTGRPPGDVFPVFYRCNTPGCLRKGLNGAGFEMIHLRTYSDCYVSAVCRLLGALALVYELAVNTLRLEGAKGFILAGATKA
ncbi:MAG: class I SAM-dependent methyltransferase [Actinomycetota bacterium]|nr:class I SAM-dependent methyltransferase [Actinomycetota bacterium]